MAIRCETAGQFGAYSCRGTGNQRHTLSHDSMLLNELHDMRLTRGTRAYSLGGMQAACKQIGAFNARQLPWSLQRPAPPLIGAEIGHEQKLTRRREGRQRAGR